MDGTSSPPAPPCSHWALVSISQDSKCTVGVLSHLLVVHDGLEAPGPPEREGSGAGMSLDGFLPGLLPTASVRQMFTGNLSWARNPGPAWNHICGPLQLPRSRSQQGCSSSLPRTLHSLAWTSFADDVRQARGTCPVSPGLLLLTLKYPLEPHIQIRSHPLTLN